MKGEWNSRLDAIAREEEEFWSPEPLPADTSEVPPPVAIRDATLRDRLFDSLPHGAIGDAAKHFYPRLTDEELAAAFAVVDSAPRVGLSLMGKMYEACLEQLQQAREPGAPGDPLERAAREEEAAARVRREWPEALQAMYNARRRIGKEMP